MKEKIIKLNSILLLFLAGILLYSCSYDDESPESSNIDGKYQITRKKLTNLFEEKKFSTSYAKLPKKKLKKTDANGRTVMEDQYGFTITSQYANEVVGDSTTSYTLAIKRDNTVQSYDQENLIIAVNNYTNSVKAVIIKYKSTTPLTTLSHFTGEKEITPIVYNANPSSTTTGKMFYGCIAVSFPCENPATETHTPGGKGCWGSTTEYFCGFFDDGGGGADGDVSGSTGSGDDGGAGSSSTGSTTNTETTPTTPTENHNEPIATVPELTDELQDQPQAANPCDLIKQNTEKNGYMVNFNNINTPEKLALNYEYGFAQVNNSYVFRQATGNESVPIPDGAKNYTHTHPNKEKIDEDGNFYNGNVKIHSPDDIYNLIVKCQRNNGANPTNAYGVVISDEGIFALTILEPLIFDIDMQNKWEKFKSDYKYNSIEILSNHQGFGVSEINARKEKMQKMLLSLLKGLGLENKIGLFEGTVNNSGATPKINWKRKKIDTSGSLTPEDC